MSSTVFAPRLRAARDRGLDLVLRRLLPSGSLGSDVDDPVALHRAALALAATGHSAAARRVLDRAARRYVTDDGDVRASASLRSVDGDCNESAARMPAMLAQASLRAGHVALAARLDLALERLRLPGGGVAVHGPRGDGAADLASTVRVATVDLLRGRTQSLADGLRWVVSLWRAQPHPDAFLMRRDASAALVTLWPASAATCHSIHALGPGSGHGILGETLWLFAQALAVAPQPIAHDVRAAGVEMLAFAARCGAWARRPSDMAALAMGAAAFARALRDDGERDVSGDGRDLAVSLALRACETWRGDGFGEPEDEPAAVRLDQAAWTACALHETLASLDEAEPVQETPAPDGWRVVLCNISEVKSHEVADTVVRERLAACVNLLGPVRSTYVWKGALERDTEVTLLIKTTADRVAALTARLRTLHPYDLPEVIALPLMATEGNVAYLDWVRAQVTPGATDPEPPEPSEPPGEA